LGFGTTVSEPALIAVAVGLALVIGVMRIIRGWPIHYLIISGYILVVLMTCIAPNWIIGIGIAYDSGGVTTSTITVPLVTALGVGLACSIKGSNAMVDGRWFWLDRLCSFVPRDCGDGLCTSYIS
jgi:hypothetical protein